MAWIDDEMRETLAVRHTTGHNASGKAYSTAVSIKAYAETNFQRITSQNGQEVTASLFLLCPADSAVGIGDEIIWQSKRYEVVSSEQVRPDGNTHHLEIYAKSAGVA
jgi:predicted RecB family nuclease